MQNTFRSTSPTHTDSHFKLTVFPSEVLYDPTAVDFRDPSVERRRQTCSHCPQIRNPCKVTLWTQTLHLSPVLDGMPESLAPFKSTTYLIFSSSIKVVSDRF